jgi:hypothetical protein
MSATREKLPNRRRSENFGFELDILAADEGGRR